MQEKTPDRLYIKLVGIFLIPLIAITAYSFVGEFTLGDFTLQQAKIASHFKPKADEPDISLIDSTLLSVSDTAVVDTTAQRILLLGDSMVEGLSKRMRNYAAENGHELLNVIWYSSSTKIWAQYDTLSHYIRQFDPTYIMLCLGGNELSVRDLDKRDEAIQTIISKIGDRPFIWIGPPNWKQDTGINELIKKNAGAGRYYPSKRLTYKRKEDGAHPVQESSNQWMDSVAVWVADSAAYRIRMVPPQSTEQKGRTVILSPLK
ncbi:SGNH/GDSL hydrolase family protein [Bacteroides sp. 51]|uniref:SGNH/GDSL hydrolase family protein n=1 Tax=Bacteroides sp. 51 TaxID=2302938 RepID=UPI0013D6E232|nr:SGNH/GDSL hydrolase family protein [Bacteroides sp. 51]NDV81131.1 SGNH/GDSL hydrolase family protein [Bacteroides sp. 51]